MFVCMMNGMDLDVVRRIVEVLTNRSSVVGHGA